MADKNLFSINITDDETNCLADQTPFTSSLLPDDLNERSTTAWSQYAKYTLKRKGAIASIKLFSYIGFALAFFGIYQAVIHAINIGSAWTLSRAFSDIPAAYLIGGVGILLFITLSVIATIKEKTFENDPQRKMLDQTCKAIAQEIEQYLHVPEDALQMEILPVYYRMTDDKWEEVLDNDGVYQNQSVDIWVKDDCICMCDEQAIISIPKSAFKGYYTIDTNFYVTTWFKKEKVVGVQKTREGYEVQTYYDIVIEHGEDLFDLLIPSYDFSVLTDMVHLPCLDAEDV